jgi:Coenzyme PQQ synthesis protein D (PqqD)
LRPNGCSRLAAEIIKGCTGEVTIAELVDKLTKSYVAPREGILADVGIVLRGVAAKRLVEV